MRRLTAATLLIAAGAAAAAAPPVGDAEALLEPLAPRSLLLDVTVIPGGGGLVVVGERGHVLLSRDDGRSWQQQPAPTRANLTAVTFVDAARGWAVGHDEVILRTTDGGHSWSRVHFAPERQQPLLAVSFDAAGHGLAVGAFSTVYRSIDGGASWQAARFEPRPLPALHGAHAAARDAMREDEGISQPHLYAVARGGSGTLYVAGEAGHLFRSDDAGQGWFELPSPYEGSFFGLLALDGRSLLAFGLRGHLYRSDDSGGSWQALASHTEALLAGGTRLADGTVVIVGLAGSVLVSRDGGHSFELHAQADRKGFDAVAAAGPGAIVVTGEGGARRLELAALGGGG